MSNLRIGFLCSEYPPDPHGGIGVFVRQLARALAARRHTIHVLAPSDHDALEKDGDVFVHRYAIRQGIQSHLHALQSRQEMAARAKGLVKKHRLQMFEAPDYRGEACFFALPCPLIVRCHGSTTALAKLRGESASTFTKIFESRLLAKADVRVAVSAFIQQRTSTRHAFQAPIPNFTDTGIFRRDPAADRIPLSFLFVGRITRKKGTESVFAIARAVLARFGAAKLTIAGADSNEGSNGSSLVEELLQTLPESARQRTQYIGWQTPEQLSRLYNEHQFLLLPGHAEAFGLVALEAMLCGCLPYVSSGGGPAEVLHRVFRPGIVTGDETAFADAIENILFRTDLDRISRAIARLAASRFSPERIVAKNEALYRHTIEEWSCR